MSDRHRHSIFGGLLVCRDPACAAYFSPRRGENPVARRALHLVAELVFPLVLFVGDDSAGADVGAFAAGLILESVPMEKYLQAEELSPDKMLHPLSAFLVPLFFVQMGLKIDFAELVSH